MACQILCVIYDYMNNQQTKYLKTPDFPGADFNFFLKQNENVEIFPVISSILKIIQKLNKSSKGCRVCWNLPAV